MLAGQFGLAAAVKGREPQVPLWALMLASQLLTIVFLALYALGIEGYGSATGGGLGYGELSLNADYSYSLVGALIISLLAFIVAATAWGRRNGLIIGFLVFSNWLLVFLVHRADLAVLPGDAGDLPHIGLGLWNVPWLAALLELVFVLAGSYLYYHQAMRTAVRAERADTKEGKPPGNYRQQSLVASLLLFVLLLGTLAANFFLGY